MEQTPQPNEEARAAEERREAAAQEAAQRIMPGEVTREDYFDGMPYGD